MSEVLVSEKKYSNGGWKISVDKDLKLVKGVITGKFNDDEMEEYCQQVIGESKKFGKGTSSYLVDTTNFDAKFVTPGQAKAIEKLAVYVSSECKKAAYIVPSFMFQKSAEQITAGKLTNDKYFTSESEAVKWLRE